MKIGEKKITALLTILAVISLMLVLQRARSQPTVIIEPLRVDLGELAKGEVATFMLFVTTTEDTEIVGAKSTCQCLNPLDPLPMKISAGEKTPLKFGVRNTSEERRELEFTVNLYISRCPTTEPTRVKVVLAAP